MNIIPLAAIAIGYDNVAGLQRVTSLTAGGVAFVDVLTAGKANRGQLRPLANGVPARDGFKSLQWMSGILSIPQHTYLTGFEGEVTIKTLWDSYTYTNFNAVLTIPEQDELELIDPVHIGLGFKNVPWKFTRVKAIV